MQKVQPMGEQIVTVLDLVWTFGAEQLKKNMSTQPHCHCSVAQLLSLGWEVWRSPVVLALNWVISKLFFVHLSVQFGAVAGEPGAYGSWPAWVGGLLPSLLLQLVLSRQLLVLPCAKLKFLLIL